MFAGLTTHLCLLPHRPSRWQNLLTAHLSLITGRYITPILSAYIILLYIKGFSWCLTAAGLTGSMAEWLGKLPNYWYWWYLACKLHFGRGSDSIWYFSKISKKATLSRSFKFQLCHALIYGTLSLKHLGTAFFRKLAERSMLTTVSTCSIIILTGP